MPPTTLTPRPERRRPLWAAIWRPMKRRRTAEAAALTKRLGILRRRPNLRLILHEGSTHNTDATARS